MSDSGSHNLHIWWKVAIGFSIATTIVGAIIYFSVSTKVLETTVKVLRKEITELRGMVIENQHDIKNHIQYHMILPNESNRKK